MNRLIVPPLPAASRPSKMITRRSPGRLDPVLQLEQLDLQQALVVLVRRSRSMPLVVRVALPPGVDRAAVAAQQDRVVVVVVVDPVLANLFEHVGQGALVRDRRRTVVHDQVLLGFRAASKCPR